MPRLEAHGFSRGRIHAGKDTADNTKIPTVDDILLDIVSFFEEESGCSYLGIWGVTDHYEADEPLHLEYGTDFTKYGA